MRPEEPSFLRGYFSRSNGLTLGLTAVMIVGWVLYMSSISGWLNWTGFLLMVGPGAFSVGGWGSARIEIRSLRREMERERRIALEGMAVDLERVRDLLLESGGSFQANSAVDTVIRTRIVHLRLRATEGIADAPQDPADFIEALERETRQ